MIDEQTGVVHELIEIKCTYSATKLTVREACDQCIDFYCSLDDTGQINLDSNHVHYYQVVGTMAITAASSCDLIVWTPTLSQWKYSVGMQIKPVLEHFYVQYVIPCILY